MQKERKEVCNTMPEFLVKMVVSGWGSRKYAAVLHRHRQTNGTMLYVEEYFDDGKGHSGAFTSKITPVSEEVFVKAVAERYISGKLEPGYVSTIEFEITELGKRAYEQKRQLAFAILENLLPDQGVHLCHLQSQFSNSSEEEIKELLDGLIWRGYVMSCGKEGEQESYLRLRRAVA